MNKILTYGLVGLLIILGAYAVTKDKNVDDSNAIFEELNTFEYLSFNGIIKEVLDHKELPSLIVENKDNPDNVIVFHIPEQVILLDQEKQEFIEANSFKAGQEITAYYPGNTPMALSMPPQLTPKVIVANSKEYSGSIHVDRFNDDLVSTDGFLKIKLNSEVKIINQDGKETSEDLRNKDLVVFYGAATRSIPAQTTPDKIIVL